MRIAAPVWKELISPVMDTARCLRVIDFSGEGNPNRFETPMLETSVAQRVGLIHRLGARILICGAISRLFHDLLTARGVDVVSGLTGPVEAVVAAYLAGDQWQRRFVMPGYTPVMAPKKHPAE